MTRYELEKDMGKFAIIDDEIAPNPDLVREIERLARIDSREVYREIDEDTFVDSDEWVDREAIWLRWVEAEENKGGIRRKEK